MTQGQKPKKKRLDLAAVLTDPGKAIGELLEDPDVADKLAIAITKLPPAAIDTLAKKIAEYMPKPPTAEEIAAKLQVEAILPESIAPASAAEIVDTVRGQLSDQITSDFNKIQTQITQIFEALKFHQDEEAQTIQKTVAMTFAQELESFKVQAKEEASRLGLGNNGGSHPGGENQPPAQGRGVLLGLSLDQVLSLVTTLSEAWAKIKPPPVAALAEDKLKAYATGFATGNKMRTGNVAPDDVAQEMLKIATPQPPAK